MLFIVHLVTNLIKKYLKIKNLNCIISPTTGTDHIDLNFVKEQKLRFLL